MENRLRELLKTFFERDEEKVLERNDTLYAGRLYLFERIPLWEVHLTKKVWLREILYRSLRDKKTLYEVEFIEE